MLFDNIVVKVTTYTKQFSDALADTWRLQFKARAELVGNLYYVIAGFTVFYVVL